MISDLPVRFGFCIILAASAWSTVGSAFVPTTTSSTTTTSSSSSFRLEAGRVPVGRTVTTATTSPGVVRFRKSGTAVFAAEPSDDRGGAEAAAVSVSEGPLQLLRDAIHRNATGASAALLSEIADLREKSGGDLVEDLLTTLLDEGPDATNLPFWTAFRPLARISKRARFRSLRRTLDLTTPPVAGGDEDEDARKRVRRRALVSLLRSLSAEEEEDDEEEDGGRRRRRLPVIVSLEKKAIRASRESASDLTARRPEGLETPAYEVLERRELPSKSTVVEIRSYRPYSVCAVSMAAASKRVVPEEASAKISSPELKGASSFGALAGYLFGKNDRSTAMKMTTPVITTQGDGGGDDDENENDDDDENGSSSTMAFVLPSEYWGKGNLEKAPLPLPDSGVTLEERDGEVRAVLMFGGYATRKEATKRGEELTSALDRGGAGYWKPAIDGEVPSLAQYNDPFTVPWKRLNEVSVRVVAEMKP